MRAAVRPPCSSAAPRDGRGKQKGRADMARWERLRPLPADALRVSEAPMIKLKDTQLVKKTGESKRPRFDASLVLLTRRFMTLLKKAPDGVLDLNQVARTLGVRKRRVYDITNVLNGINLIKKRSKNLIQWIGNNLDQVVGKAPEQQNLKDELSDLADMEEALDELIKNCAHQIFELTDDRENAKLAYVTYQDIRSIEAFQEQIVMAIKAPEETKLEIPVPKVKHGDILGKGDESVEPKELDPLLRSPVVSLVKGAVSHPVEMKKIQFQIPPEAIKGRIGKDHIEVHVKSTKGPIDVFLCEVEKEKPDGKTCEDMDTVTSETETSFYPDEVRSPMEEKKPFEIPD